MSEKPADTLPTAARIKGMIGDGSFTDFGTRRRFSPDFLSAVAELQKTGFASRPPGAEA